MKSFKVTDQKLTNGIITGIHTFMVDADDRRGAYFACIRKSTLRFAGELRRVFVNGIQYKPNTNKS